MKITQPIGMTDAEYEHSSFWTISKSVGFSGKAGLKSPDSDRLKPPRLGA